MGRTPCLWGSWGGTLFAVPPWGSRPQAELWDGAGRRMLSPPEHLSASTPSSREPNHHHHPQELFFVIYFHDNPPC